MRKKWLIFAAAVTALGITACGNGDGIVINGTTAAEAESDQPEGTDSLEGGETTSGTKIEIITGETTASFSTAEETAAQSAQEWTQAAQTQPETTAAPQTASATKAAAETTAAKKYSVTDVKKTMYATASLRVRSSYSTSSDVLAALSDGEKVEVTGQVENGWMRVKYKGIVGYVSGSYLTETPPATKSSTSNSAGQTNGQTNHSSNTQAKPTTTTGTGTTPGGSSGTGANSAGSTGPTAGTNSAGATNPGNTGGPSAGTNSGAASPAGSTNSGGGTSTGGGTVSGTVTALDPSGVTVQASNGTSYQFVWGSAAPDLVDGDRVNISYETTSSGEKKITGVSK